MPSSKAIRAGRAFVELFADDSKLVRGLRLAERRVQAFGRKISGIGRKLAGLGAAVATPIAMSVRVFAGFDDQMRAVQAVIGATGADFDRLNEKAKLLGPTTSYTAAPVADAYGMSLEQTSKAVGSLADDTRQSFGAIGEALAAGKGKPGDSAPGKPSGPADGLPDYDPAALAATSTGPKTSARHVRGRQRPGPPVRQRRRPHGHRHREDRTQHPNP